MSWQMLHLQRIADSKLGTYGALYVRDKTRANWKRLSYAFELPWKADAKGKSKSSKSRIKAGTYEMKVRTDGDKGWRFELLGTGHREYIQVHRAHESLYIEGCILPVLSIVPKIGKTTQTNSENLMRKIKSNYTFWKAKKLKEGKPTIEISRNAPKS